MNALVSNLRKKEECKELRRCRHEDRTKVLRRRGVKRRVTKNNIARNKRQSKRALRHTTTPVKQYFQDPLKREKYAPRPTST